jgi:hypothetical protein
MMRKRKAEPIAAELVVSTGSVRVPAEIVPSNADQFQKAITRLVEQKVTEALSGKDSVFQPWFGSQAVSAEIRKRQTVAEQQKFARYFEEYGCMVCGKKNCQHCNLGMCQRCNVQIRNRLNAIVRQHTQPQEPFQGGFRDTVRLAREALRETPKTLPAPARKRKP